MGFATPLQQQPPESAPERSITSNGEQRRAAPRRTGEARTVNRALRAAGTFFIVAFLTSVERDQ
jgi:hypothetical protein